MRNCFVKLLFVLISFVNTNRAIVFECDFSSNYNWIVIGKEYTCRASILPDDNTFLLNVTGTHMEGFSNDDVLALLVPGQNVVSRIPHGIENFFPNLQLMSWDSGSLTTIDADDFKPFPYLSQLVMGSTKIVSLDSGLFKYTPKLQWIHFYGNLLQHVGDDLLTNLSSLTWADFRSNPCIDFVAQTSVEVQELNLLLPIQCPQLEPSTPTPTDLPPTTTTIFTTTPSEDCPIGCSSRIESVEKNVSIKTDELSRQSEIISQLQFEVSDLNVAIDNYEMRIVELEKLVREISSGP